jgi:hypothetical protein
MMSRIVTAASNSQSEIRCRRIHSAHANNRRSIHIDTVNRKRIRASSKRRLSEMGLGGS